MKLHLPKMLAVALLSACAAISANADVPYTGTVYTWDNTTSGSDPAFGNYAKTTYDEQGNPTVTSTVISGRAGNWGNVQAIFASDAIQTGNTMRFDSTHGQNVKTLTYTFTPFTVGGIIVEEGATGFSIQSGGTNNRAFFLGNKDGSASYNKIHEDFAINKTTGNLTLTLRGAETMEVASGKTFTLKSNNPIAMSGSLIVTGEGTVDFAQGNVTMANGFSLTVQKGATLKFASAVTGLSRTIVNDGTISFNGAVTVTDLAGFEGDTTYSNGDNGFIIAAEYTLIKGEGTDNLTSITVGTSQYDVVDGVVTIADPDYSTYHLATDGASVDAGAQQAAHPELATIAFHAATGTVQASQNASVALNLAANTTATLDVAATLTVTNNLTVSSTQGLVTTGNGTVSLGTLTVNGGTVSAASNMALSNLELSGAADVTFNGALVNVSGAVHTTANGSSALKIGTGASATTFVVNRLELDDAQNNTETSFVIGEKGRVVVTSTNNDTGYKTTGLLFSEWGQSTHAQIQGELYAKDAMLSTGDKAAIIDISGVLATKGIRGIKNVNNTINLAEGGKLVLGESGIASGTGAWAINLNGGEVGISADTTIARDLTVAGDVTFNTDKYLWSGTGAEQSLTEGSEGGTLTISGNITGTGTITKMGEGTLVLSGANNVLTHTIAANEGSMTLRGSYEIGDIALVGTTVYGDGEHEGNGYATATGSVTVYDGAAKDSVNADAATFTFHGSTVTVTDGVYTLPGTQDTSTYYINNKTDSYSWIDTNKKGELTGGIVVAEIGTLFADKDMSMSVVSASSKGTVEIDEDVVVTAAGGTQTVKLTGYGTYALASGAQTIGSVNVDSFDGYVRLSGNIANIDLKGNLGSNNVEFKGLSGHFKNLTEGTDDTYNGNIRLVDDGDTPAIKITDGYSRNESEYIFAGDISGEGTWELNCGATQHYVFTGSLEDWTGEFKVTKSGPNNNGTSLAFRGDATTVNAAITRNGGTLKLIVENDATFRKDVTGITSLTVSEGKEATFNGGTTSIGSLIGKGDVTVNGDLTLTGTTTTSSEAEGATNFTGTLNLDGDATLTVAGNVDLGGHLNAGEYAITVQGTGSLTLTEDSTIGSVISNSGFVSLTGLTLDDSVFTETEGEDAHFDLAGHMTDDANYFEGTAADYVRVVNGGTSTGSGLAWGDKDDYVLTADGKIITGVEDIDYGTFYVGGEISTSAINASEHVAAIENINVGDGATLTVDAVSEAAIHAQDGATVAGEHAQDRVEIAADATVTYAYGISSTEGVYVFGLDGVSVTNNSGYDAKYGGLDNDAMAVEADALSSSVNDEYVVNNQLSVSMVTHQGEGELTLAHVNGDALSVVETDTADLILQGITATTLSELTIGAGATVAVYTDELAQTEGTVTIDAEGILTAGAGTLRADLTLEGGSTLDVNGGSVEGGTQNALTLGSTLTVNTTTGFINLDNDTLIALDGLGLGQRLTLVKALDGSTLTYGDDGYNGTWYSQMFNREGSQYTLEGDFQVFAEADGFGLVKVNKTPEPTTGTLSLLALAALAARRRRH